MILRSHEHSFSFLYILSVDFNSCAPLESNSWILLILLPMILQFSMLLLSILLLLLLILILLLLSILLLLHPPILDGSTTCSSVSEEKIRAGVSFLISLLPSQKPESKFTSTMNSFTREPIRHQDFFKQ